MVCVIASGNRARRSVALEQARLQAGVMTFKAAGRVSACHADIIGGPAHPVLLGIIDRRPAERLVVAQSVDRFQPDGIDQAGAVIAIFVLAADPIAVMFSRPDAIDHVLKIADRQRVISQRLENDCVPLAFHAMAGRACQQLIEE